MFSSQKKCLPFKLKIYNFISTSFRYYSATFAINSPLSMKALQFSRKFVQFSAKFPGRVSSTPQESSNPQEGYGSLLQSIPQETSALSPSRRWIGRLLQHNKPLLQNRLLQQHNKPLLHNRSLLNHRPLLHRRGVLSLSDLLSCR